jgi:hypothetical protein
VTAQLVVHPQVRRPVPTAQGSLSSQPSRFAPTQAVRGGQGLFPSSRRSGNRNVGHLQITQGAAPYNPSSTDVGDPYSF